MNIVIESNELNELSEFSFENFKKNPIVILNHDLANLIGMCKNYIFREGKIEFEINFKNDFVLKPIYKISYATFKKQVAYLTILQ